MLSFLLALIVISILVTLLSIKTAPLGYEDERGFHYIKKD